MRSFGCKRCGKASLGPVSLFGRVDLAAGALSSSTSIAVSTEQIGEKTNRRKKVMLFIQLPNHDILMEAVGLFIDGKGRYWDVPESISLDLLSQTSKKGFRHTQNGCHHQAVNAAEAEVPSSLMPGLCAKAAFSYEKSRDIWMQEETREDVVVKREKGLFWRRASERTPCVSVWNNWGNLYSPVLEWEWPLHW